MGPQDDGQRRRARPRSLHRICSIGIGLPTEYLEIEPGSAASFDGEGGSLDEEVARSTATVTVSATDPMIAVRQR